ncbi:MAG: hypothetical protein WB783_15675, partial [Arenicellales bacterium]
IPDNPTTFACITAMIKPDSCSSGSGSQACYSFTASVDGETVTITDPVSCNLELTGVTLTAENGLSGSYSYDTGGSSPTVGVFVSMPGGSGCLPCS